MGTMTTTRARDRRRRALVRGAASAFNLPGMRMRHRGDGLQVDIVKLTEDLEAAGAEIVVASELHVRLR